MIETQDRIAKVDGSRAQKSQEDGSQADGSQESMVAPSGKTCARARGGGGRKKPLVSNGVVQLPLGVKSPDRARSDARSARTRSLARGLCAAVFFSMHLASGAFLAVPATSPGAQPALAESSLPATIHQKDYEQDHEGDRVRPWTSRVGDVGWTVHPKTLEMIEWFDARGLFRSVVLGPDGHVDQVICEAVPAAGVVLPDVPFRTAGIRCNDAGEIVEILPASSDNDQCELFVLMSDPNPRTWIYTCFGPCPAPSACVLGIDLATLEFACACIP